MLTLDTILTIILLVVAVITMIATLFLVADKFWPKIKLRWKHRNLLRALRQSKLNLEPDAGGYSDTAKRINIRTIVESKSYQFIAYQPRKDPYLRRFEVAGTHDIEQQAQTVFQEMINSVWKNYQNASTPPHERAYNLDVLEFYANN